MSAFDLISLVIGVSGLLIALIGFPAFVLAWVQASDEAKEKYRSVWAGIRHKFYRGWVYLSCAVLVATGVWKMVEFLSSKEPMTRLDVFLLLANFMSLGVFSLTSVALIVMFKIEDVKKARRLAMQ